MLWSIENHILSMSPLDRGTALMGLNAPLIQCFIVATSQGEQEFNRPGSQRQGNVVSRGSSVSGLRAYVVRRSGEE
ncbi:Os04g0655900 [Oryza sativa Japonica Group]|uniref:Os04g0655900 protein n=1 Tax=Oryza sativa subsp. japonica TaxID=39947 RepID=A0A0P0WG03_ORYSJ|nr:Os04g0655900 [Oryza sativa Japonica Group]